MDNNILESFNAKVKSHRKRLGISNSPAWYRGHTSRTFTLLPSIMRRKNGLRHERNLYALFLREGRHLLPAFKSSWELLAIMQHHGVPTRLLDWTASLDTALFFALIGRGNDPTLWILNPFKLNLKSTNRNVVYDSADDLGIDYHQALKSDTGWPFDLPLAIAPPWINERIRAQRGFFTVHGNSTTPLEKSCSSCVKRVQLEPELVKVLRRELKNSGTDWYRLFPDLDGLGRSLKTRFRF